MTPNTNRQPIPLNDPVIRSDYDFDTTIKNLTALGENRFDVTIQTHIITEGRTQLFMNFGQLQSRNISVAGNVETDGDGCVSIHYSTELDGMYRYIEQRLSVFIFMIMLGFDGLLLFVLNAQPVGFSIAWVAIVFFFRHHRQIKSDQIQDLLTIAVQKKKKSP